MAKNYRKKAMGITTKSVNRQQTDAIAVLQKKVNSIKIDKPELNVVDSTLDGAEIHWATGTPGSTTYTAMQLPDPSLTTGTGYYGNRIGSKIMIKRIEIRGFLKINQDAAKDSASVRVMLVRFPKTVTVATPSYVLSNVTQGLGIVSPYNTVTRAEYNVLWDRRVGLAKFGGDTKIFTYSKNCNYVVNYVGDGTSVANGGLVLFVFSDQDGANPPIMDLFARIKYEG